MGFTKLYHIRNKERNKERNMFKFNADYFILPNSDEFFLEYLPESEKRLQYVSGFTGSSAQIIFGREKNYFFTDGRYILQAQNELDLQKYEIFNITSKSLLSWLKENIKSSQIIAIDAKLHSVNFVKNLQKIIDESGAKLEIIKPNPIDEIWSNRPLSPNSQIFFHPLQYSGVDSISKRNLILQGFEGDAILLSKPESICWLLNIRASDTEYTPLLACYAILYKDGEVDLFIDESRLNTEARANLKNINYISPNNLEQRLKQIRQGRSALQIDTNSLNFWLYNIVTKLEFTIIDKVDPCLLLKACKNSTEINGAIQAHITDGIAMVKFLHWLDKNITTQANIDELSCEEKLLEFRKENPNFVYPSFRSISSFASNGAIIHYHATAQSNKKISGNSLYLIDSGGQYYQGTTDITRTILIGEVDDEIKTNFTLVLQGHIALACTKFPRTTTGAQLDAIARAPLLQQGKDFEHGTGHGVGSFLSVHEGPCSISKYATKQELLPGMILSNEPGYYVANAYGIRIESLMLVEEYDQNSLQFRTLTLVPIDFRLINFKMLNNFEKNWLYDYHKNVFFILEKYLDAHTSAYLASFEAHYKKVLKY